MLKGQYAFYEKHRLSGLRLLPCGAFLVASGNLIANRSPKEAKKTGVLSLNVFLQRFFQSKTDQPNCPSELRSQSGTPEIVKIQIPKIKNIKLRNRGSNGRPVRQSKRERTVGGLDGSVRYNEPNK